jgi:hypothetical protein
MIKSCYRKSSISFCATSELIFLASAPPIVVAIVGLDIATSRNTRCNAVTLQHARVRVRRKANAYRAASAQPTLLPP